MLAYLHAALLCRPLILTQPHLQHHTYSRPSVRCVMRGALHKRLFSYPPSLHMQGLPGTARDNDDAEQTTTTPAFVLAFVSTNAPHSSTHCETTKKKANSH